MSDCIFCAIANHEIPSEIVYEDDKICVYKDLAPQAPVHVLMIPKKHIANLDDVTADDQELLGYMLLKVQDIAKLMGIENGYRVVSNNGDDAEQTVKHMHLHIFLVVFLCFHLPSRLHYYWKRLLFLCEKCHWYQEA